MKARLISWSLAALLLGGVFASATVQAQQDDPVRQLRTQLRDSMRLQQETEAARRRAEEAAATANTELESVRQREAGLGRDIAVVRNRALAAERESDVLRLRVSELERQLAVQQDQHKKVEAEFELHRREVATATTRGAVNLAQCHKDNELLAQSAHELLDAYASKSVLEVFGEADPVIGVGRVRLENLIERYRERIEDASIPRAASAR